MDFQPEIIRLILAHLDDVEDLKKCLLTSDEIREIIIKTPELMRRLTLIMMHLTWKDKLPFVEKYGFFVRALKLDDIGFDSNEEFMKILRQTPNLERLIVEECYIASERETDNDNEDGEQENNDVEMNHAVNANDEENAANLQEPQIINEMEVEENAQAEPPPAHEPQGENMEIQQDNLNEIQNANLAEHEENLLNNNNNNNNNNINNNNNQIDINLEVNHENIQNNDIEPAPVAPIDRPQNENIVNDEINPPTIEQNKEIELLNLKHLNHLHLESSTISEAIVKSLPNCNTLKILKLTFYYQEPVNTFTNLLCQQDNLEELNLQGWSEMVFKSLFKEDIRDKIKFRLKKFYLECEMSYHTNFSNFLRSQASHIRELELTCYNINFHYYRMIFNHFHNLVKLNIPVDWFLTDGRVNSVKDCRIESLRELELVGANDDITSFKTIINIFPNIEILKCENLQNFSLRGILENFKRLKTIRSENFRCETLLFVKLPTLKNIETGFLLPFAMDFLWQNLAEDCPSVENISIEDIGQFKLNESIRIEFANILKNLKYFKNLKTCKIMCTPQENTVNADHDAGELADVIPEQAFYKINVNVDERTIKISHYFAQHCADEVQILRETFKDCDITEV